MLRIKINCTMMLNKALEKYCAFKAVCVAMQQSLIHVTISSLGGGKEGRNHFNLSIMEVVCREGHKDGNKETAN